MTTKCRTTPLSLGLAAGMLLLFTGCGDDSPTSPGQASGRMIAFMSSANGDFEIYLFDPSGPSIEAITENEAFDGYPAFHPDGTSIVFTSDRDGDPELYRMSRDGSDVVRLTEASGDDSTPAYSPDGSLIAFASQRDGDSEIYIMNADGSGQRRLTDSPGLDSSPFFPPDGDALFWVSDRDGSQKIYRMALDGSDPQVVLGEPDEEIDRPGFDPASGRLIYSSTLSGSPDLWRAEADGTEITRLTISAAPEIHPTVSPDGRAIAFSAALDSAEEDLFVLDPGTGEFIQITTGVGRDLWPAFDPSPGG